MRIGSRHFGRGVGCEARSTPEPRAWMWLPSKRVGGEVISLVKGNPFFVIIKEVRATGAVAVRFHSHHVARSVLLVLQAGGCFPSKVFPSLFLSLHLSLPFSLLFSSSPLTCSAGWRGPHHLRDFAARKSRPVVWESRRRKKKIKGNGKKKKVKAKVTMSDV